VTQAKTGSGALTGDPLVADIFRRWGYLAADLDPLGRLATFHHPELDEALRLAERSGEAARLRSIYCGPIGADFMRLPYPDRCRFIAARMEAPPPAADRKRLLRRLAESELFERFLHARYVGTKRYSLEGAASLIPLLDAVLDAAAEGGAVIALIGMSHRGRLNVMANVIGVPPSCLFAQFEDIAPDSVMGSGDVRYHLGATGTYPGTSGRNLDVHLVSNASHLEAVDPVVMGRARARQERLAAGGSPGAVEPRAGVLPVVLHGDAAFAGQGIAAETLNLSEIPGFTVGGTVHVVINNLIGFTTEPRFLHSTRFAAEVARRLDAPILHVNGFDPEAAARAGRMALEYRARFGTDVVVDLIGFRRYGHSEVDDPTTSQPILYRTIQDLPMQWQTYAERIGAGPDETEALERAINARLQAELDRGRTMTKVPALRTLPKYWDRYTGGRYDETLEVDTAVPAATLEEIARRITAVPAGFRVHAKVARGLELRLLMGRGRRPVDFGMAEALAFGSLLIEGTPVRLSGQDSRRGTFNQRHAVLIDTETGAEHYPLAHVFEGQARFAIYDTPLSEAAPLGFEYGFSRDSPETLVLWEAQFGDFANGAQVIIDQFLAAGEDKWGLLSGLVLLLPHGYEGQGAEHSSARLERFLHLAAEDNIQVCQPTTAAQYFHLLRRQARRCWRKPLVVLTPKGMLRAPASSSPIADFTTGRFRAVIPDETIADPARVLLCSGKIAHELRAERDKRGDTRTAVVRVEQLYPFPRAAIDALLRAHPAASEIIWVQEEPRNMGALDFVRKHLQGLLGDRHLASVSRAESASPATGSTRAHALEQQALVQFALQRKPPAVE
jgi:2-oxoglutarate dehydrogenase E1 component